VPLQVVAQRRLERVELLGMPLDVGLLVEPRFLHELAHGVDGEAVVEAAPQRVVEVLARSCVAQGHDRPPQPPLGLVDLRPFRKAFLARVLV
jgi:hypothetical protein